MHFEMEWGACTVGSHVRNSSRGKIKDAVAFRNGCSTCRRAQMDGGSTAGSDSAVQKKIMTDSHEVENGSGLDKSPQPSDDQESAVTLF